MRTVYLSHDISHDQCLEEDTGSAIISLPSEDKQQGHVCPGVPMSDIQLCSFK